MKQIQDLDQIRETIHLWRQDGQRIAFVPTMGALHEGHLSLVRLAKEHAEKVVVSIFVNPSQFNDASDFDRYPRVEDKDIPLLKTEGVDLVYLPPVEVMYPDQFVTNIHVSKVTDDLEGAHRPGHFDGVATVVTKLLLQVMPDTAIFGQKDFQQLCLIKNMVRDLNIPVEIIGAPTKRDEEGLALSSRNVFLSDEGIAKARQLNKVLFDLADKIESRKLKLEDVSKAGQDMLKENGISEIDYIELRTALSLEKVDVQHKREELRLLAAVTIDGVRLIDNVAVKSLSAES